MAANYPVQEYGITGFVHMRRHKIGRGGNGTNVGKDNLDINSVPDDKPVRINSRDYAQTSGTSIGFQCKPNQAVTGAAVHGFEVQPRFADGIGGTDLVGGNISAILKGTTGNLSGAVHVLEIETDFNGAASPTRTITGEISMIRFSPDFPASMTLSAGIRSVFAFAPFSFQDFTHLFRFTTANTTLVQNAALGSVSKMIPVLSTDGTTTLYIPLYPHS